MNLTNNYNDQLDGEFLACKPGSVAEGLEIVCTFGMNFIGATTLLNGLFCLYLAYIQRRYRKLFVGPKTTLATVRRHGHRNSPKGPSAHVSKESRAMENVSYVEKLLISMGAFTVGGSLWWLGDGVGTMYPTTHLRGQIGDASATVCYSAVWYMSLLQYKGAVYFKSSVPKQENLLQAKNSSTTRCHLPSPSRILDILQSWLSPVIGLVLLGLLRAGVYSRGWFVFSLAFLHGICGMRSFVSILIQRLATLKQLSAMVAAIGGTTDDKRRRGGVLASSITSLIIDIIAVLFFSVLWPGSIIFLGSTFNSRKFAVHMIILGVPNVVAITLTNFHLYKKFSTSRRRNETALSKELKKQKKQSSVSGMNSKVSPTIEYDEMSMLDLPGADLQIDVAQSDISCFSSFDESKVVFVGEPTRLGS